MFLNNVPGHQPVEMFRIKSTEAELVAASRATVLSVGETHAEIVTNAQIVTNVEKVCPQF